VDVSVALVSSARATLAAKRAVLIVAHPGHELRLHGWLELVAPRVLVLTDGSGRGECSRLPSTARVLAAAGATPGPVFGCFTDRAAYTAMLARDPAPFVALAAELADALLAADYVVADAAEGYNPVHDVCRFLVDAAVAQATRRAGRLLGNFSFPLVGPPEPAPAGPGATRLVLDDAAFARKLAAARTYPELASEVGDTLARVAAADFRVEVLTPVPAGTTREPLGRPYYERYGEAQVARGYYTSVVRWHDHLRPIAEALAAGGA
jgi:hypothetical protein